LKYQFPAGRQLRALDKIDRAFQPALDYLDQVPVAVGSGATNMRMRRTVVILDNAQDLVRFTAPHSSAGIHCTTSAAASFLISMPEMLRAGNRLAIVTVGRLALSSLIPKSREPPTVAFPAYTEEQAEAALLIELKRDAMRNGPVSLQRLELLVQCGLLKFAVPYLGCDLRALLSIGREVLKGLEGLQPLEEDCASTNGCSFLEVLQRRVQEAVDARIGLGNLGNICESTADTSERSIQTANAVMRRMTRAEKRLVLSTYLASRIRRDDDQQLFLTGDKRRRRKGSGTHSRRNDDLPPMIARSPLPTTVVRIMAIFHHLARQPQILGPQLLDHFARLRECGLIKLEHAHRENDARVLCCVELPMARAIARELDVDLVEYLCEL
jgi:hypothetical protein